MRFALPLVAALAIVGLAACGGGDETTVEQPVPLAQRVLTEADAPGTKPDPVETQQSTTMLDEFVDELHMRAVDPDEEVLTELFTDAGFQGAVSDIRFYGEAHTPMAPHVDSTVIELESDEGAESAFDWLVEDSLKPCPETCANQISEFEVDDIPDARGVRRSQSKEDIEARGRPDDVPFDSYRIAFTDGVFVYAVDLHGPPGSVTEDEATDIAHALHERVGDLSS